MPLPSDSFSLPLPSSLYGIHQTSYPPHLDNSIYPSSEPLTTTHLPETEAVFNLQKVESSQESEILWDWDWNAPGKSIRRGLNVHSDDLQPDVPTTATNALPGKVPSFSLKSIVSNSNPL